MTEIHGLATAAIECRVVGCTVWSDYSADVLFDDGSAIVFGAGLDAFVRASRGAGAATARQRLAIDLQFHYTSHALSRDIGHVGAALKLISTVCPRPKFLRLAVKAAAAAAAAAAGGGGGVDEAAVMHWRAAPVLLEEYVAPPASDVANVVVDADGSVAVSAVGGNASLRLSANGAFFDVTWPARAFDSDGRSIEFVAASDVGAAGGSGGAAGHTAGVNTVKSVLCVAHAQRFPVGTAIDAARHCRRVPAYRDDGVEGGAESSDAFWAPLACWAPLLRVALRAWRERGGGACSEAVATFIDGAAPQGLEPTSVAVTANFPPPIPPKACAVVSPFPRLSLEDAATLLASTADRLHRLPSHARVHNLGGGGGGAARLCVAWCAGERACWSAPEPGVARSLVLEDMSLVHADGLSERAPMSVLHVQHAGARGAAAAAARTGSAPPPAGSLVPAAKVYSCEARGALDGNGGGRGGAMLPVCVVVPAGYVPCRDHAAAAVAGFLPRPGVDGDPRRGRYLAGEVEFLTSFVAAARVAGASSSPSALALGAVPLNSSVSHHGGTASSAAGACNASSSGSLLAMLNRSHACAAVAAAGGGSDSGHGEGIGAVKVASTIPNVGVFTAFQDGTVRCCFDDRTILSLKPESVAPTASHSPYFTGDDVFVTALDNRAVSTRFRAAACTPQHPMHPYLQYALPFLRYASLRPAERAQLADPMVLTTCTSDFGDQRTYGVSASGTEVVSEPVLLASQLARVVARSNLSLQQHSQSSLARRQLISKCEH